MHPQRTRQGVVVPEVGSVDHPSGTSRPGSGAAGCKIVQDAPRADDVSIEVMITIHMIADGADRASRWYQDIFGAVERSRIELPDGRLIHVELALSGSALMLADEFPEHQALSPATTGQVSATFYLHVEDVDTVWQRALTGGAEVVRDLAETFWGEREGQITDPFGHRWGLTQHLRDVPIEEMARKAADAFAS